MILLTEICLKIPVILRELFEDKGVISRWDKGWKEFWDELESLQESRGFRDRVLLFHKPSSSSSVLKDPDRGIKKEKDKDFFFILNVVTSTNLF